MGSLPQSDVESCSNLIKTQGYAVIPDFYTAELCGMLKSSLMRALEEYEPCPGSTQSLHDRYHIHDLMNRDFLFCKLLEDPRLQQLLAPILGESWIMYAFTSSSIPPHGTNHGSRIHNDCPRFTPGYVFNMGIIWCLDRFTNENAATYVLPGSHKSDEAPSEEYFNRNCIQLSAPQGTLILFNAGLYHRAGENKTNEWRHAITLNACRSYMKQRMDWVRLLKTEFTDRLNEQARRIIGFDTRIPASMDEFFLPDDDRLYKPGQG